MAKLKSNVQYQPVVESVSRKFVPKKDTCTAGKTAGPVKVESQGWMGGAVRSTGRAGLGASTRNYLVIRANARATDVTNKELENRANFAKAIRGRKAILTDLSQITRVQQMWLQVYGDPTLSCNGIQGYGYTMKGWIVAVQMAGLKEDPSYDANVFPQAFD